VEQSKGGESQKQPRKKKTPSPKPEVLKLEGSWKDAIRESLKKKSVHLRAGPNPTNAIVLSIEREPHLYIDALCSVAFELLILIVSAQRHEQTCRSKAVGGGCDGSRT
jgi:hypothetical protein